MNNEPKQLDCVLYCNATAGLQNEINAELKMPDKSIASILGDKKDEDNKKAEGDSDNCT